ncbi:ATP-binding protein [Lactobacillus johnsonii]|uniref:ATP-binding protein n=2 Tax=Lactobacillus johnsonii TaxID=33959 RepID=UPI002A933CC8|nr:ATP-binding protein [Lactobacillus johnsonii]MCI7715509.1 ATP-binding protein [Lactobacillus johnsonii]MDY5350894.1 ATP-binding protein [Lactobacillus johnsonii]
MNPFNPTFGDVPKIFLDRTKQLDTVIKGLEHETSPYHTTLVYGLRGSGKTTFLSDISNQMSKKDNWIVINLAVGEDLLITLVKLIYDRMNNKFHKIFDQLDWHFELWGISFNKESQKLESNDARIILEGILKQLKAKGIKVLVTLDEAQSTVEVKQFATTYQLMRREKYDIFLIMTGLPSEVSELQNDDILTFLLRSGRITLTPLDAISMKYSYLSAFTKGRRKIDDVVLTKMVRMTAGYAYAFQLLGYLVWDTEDKLITDNTLQTILPEYKEMLFRNVYVKVYSSLSPKDKEFIQAMIESDEDKVAISKIMAKMDKPKNYISIYRRRLIDDQVIISKERGSVEFTLPYFADFVEEFGDMY